MRKINLTIKRGLDFILTLVGTIITSPVILVISILIKCTSKGPVFFKQERLGLHGRPFRIIKFRTMVVNAEHMGTGVVINEKDDPRVTKIGRFLRSTSLDELPQVFNVLKGDMSLVGPRPPVTYHPYEGYENYPEWAKKRFEMRPGMTGLVQVTIRSDASWDCLLYTSNAYDIEQELKRKYPELNLVVLIGSVRDSRRIDWVFETYKPDIVYHAAAHKHVPLMEGSPNEAIKNNVIGTYKTAYAALKSGCQRFVSVSYTHLDVYKRQVLENPFLNNCS